MWLVHANFLPNRISFCAFPWVRLLSGWLLLHLCTLLRIHLLWGWMLDMCWCVSTVLVCDLLSHIHMVLDTVSDIFIQSFQLGLVHASLFLFQLTPFNFFNWYEIAFSTKHNGFKCVQMHVCSCSSNYELRYKYLISSVQHLALLVDMAMLI